MAKSKNPREQQAYTTSPSKELEHITKEMYRRNLELAERNKTLSLLRKIDEIVLGAETNVDQVAKAICELLVSDADFSLAAIWVSKNSHQSMAASAKAGHAGLKNTLADSKLQHSSKLFAEAHKKSKILTTDNLADITGTNAKDGKGGWFICPLGARGRHIGTLLIGVDVLTSNLSEYRRSLIERLAVSSGIAIDNKLLYEEIQEASAKLKATNRRLKELDKAKDEFISMASHQLRTPLTSIKGYLSMLLEGDAGGLTQKQREFADLGFTSAQRMVYLIADLLNVSRISTGKLIIEPTKVDLNKLITEEIDQLAKTAETKGVKLDFKPQPVPPVYLDEGKTRQVIMNFMDNSTYYAPNSTVEIKLGAEGDMLRFTVRDHGIGVPKKEQEKLFSKFFRAGNAQKLRPDGTGLGLYMAKMVIEMQGGKIIFESKEGAGSTFGFEFPLDEVAAPAKTETQAEVALAKAL